MTNNGNDDLSNRRILEGKGKGKGRENEEGNDGQQSGGLLRSVIESARSSVTPQALQSVLAAGGKGGSGGMMTTNSHTSMQAMYDANGMGGSTNLMQRLPSPLRNSIRTLPRTHVGDDNAYNQFAATDEERYLVDRFSRDVHLGPNNPQSSSSQPQNPALVGPFNAASQLDQPMHEYVRSAMSQQSQQEQYSQDLQEAWEDASTQRQYPDTVYDPNYHDAWARNIPAPMFPSILESSNRGEVFHNLQQTIVEPRNNNRIEFDFMDTLANEERNEQQIEQMQHATSTAAQSPFASAWRPPTPSERPSITQEQYELHRKLAEQQDSTTGQSADERVKPPDDDQEARTGIYAATPEDALRSIWDGKGEGERASQHVRTIDQIRTSDAANVIRKVRRLLKRGSYADDVYGLPPALVATIAQAEEPETDLNKDLRAKAIARLGALYQHLEGGSSVNQSQHGEDDLNKFVRDW